MIRLLGKIPNKINIAFSGGVDSLVAAHFFKQGKKDVTLFHFNHGCEYSDHIEGECMVRAEELGLNIIVRYNSTPDAPPGVSKEDHWRRQRYKFLTNTGGPTMTCHHLDDAMETWVWSSLHGEPKTIPYSRQNIIRPFLLTPKSELVDYATRHNLVPVDDPYNDDLSLTRNYIRANLMPHVKVVNPGLAKVVRKMYLNGEHHALSSS